MKRLWIVILSICSILFFADHLIAQKPDSLKLARSITWVTTTEGCYKTSPKSDPELDAIVKGIYEHKIQKLAIGERIASIGKLLLGRPYLRTLNYWVVLVSQMKPLMLLLILFSSSYQILFHVLKFIFTKVSTLQ